MAVRVVALLVLVGCAAPERVGLAVAVGDVGACASAVGRGTWCWGYQPAAFTGVDFEAGIPYGLDAVDLDLDTVPMALVDDGTLTAWGAPWALPQPDPDGGPTTLATDVVAIDGALMLHEDGRLTDLYGGTYGDDVALFSGPAPYWVSTRDPFTVVDSGGLLHASGQPWTYLDQRGVNVCGIAGGDHVCLAGDHLESSWDGDVVGFPEFPQKDGFPLDPDLVQVEVDVDGLLCVRDADGRIACRGGGVPDEVITRQGWVDVDVAAGTVCALHFTGEVACWGNDENGRASPP